MNVDSTISPFRHPDAVDDPLTSVLRDGARRLLAEAIEAEADAFLATMREERLENGRARFVRHGHGPERVIQTGIGPVPVQRTKIRDRIGEDGSGSGAEPTDRQMELSFAQKASIMDDSEKEACHHQAHRNFGIDPWPSRTRRVAVRDSFAQPRKIQNAVDADEMWSSGRRSRSEPHMYSSS